MISIDVDTAVVVPVNVMPLLDDTDFKTRETTVAYNAAGMDLVWNFVTSAGVVTQTAVTPTTAGDYDWAHAGDGMYTIEIPASGGASINNDTEGYGYFTGVCDGVLPWRGPTIQFRAAALNDALCDGGDNLDVDLVNAPNATALAAIRTEMDSNSTKLASIVDDTNELQGLWTTGGSRTITLSSAASYAMSNSTAIGAIDARIPAALVGGRIDATVDGTGMEAGAVAVIQSGLATSAALTSLAGVFTGITSMLDILGVMAGKTADAAALAELNAATGATSYDNITDSLEAVADAGGGGATVNVTTEATNIISENS